MTSQHNAIVSVEDSENFENPEDYVKFDANSITLDTSNIRIGTNGVFINIKHKVREIMSSFILQTPEVQCTLKKAAEATDKTPAQYRATLLMDSIKKDPSFDPKELDLQQKTVNVLNDLKIELQKQINANREKIMEKTKRIKDSVWTSMVDQFEILNSCELDGDVLPDGTKNVRLYLNPKIFNKAYFNTTFTYIEENENGDKVTKNMSYYEFIENYCNTKIYGVAKISIDSIFIQSSSKIFIQTRVVDFFISRVPVSSEQQPVVPKRFQNNVLSNAQLKLQNNIKIDTHEVVEDTRPDTEQV